MIQKIVIMKLKVNTKAIKNKISLEFKIIKRKAIKKYK